MGRDWKQWVRDKGLKKWFRRDNLIVLVLAGILLFIIALPVREDKDEEKDNASTGQDILTFESLKGAEGSGTESWAQQNADTDEEYAVYLEKRLTDALSRMEDVGKVKVMITLKASRELVVEKDRPGSRSTTNESDAQGGSRIVSQMDTEEDTVYITDGSRSVPYVVKTYVPQIEGVLVVAEGAGSGTVNRTIVGIVEALFGVEAHKVMVVKMESN